MLSSFQMIYTLLYGNSQGFFCDGMRRYGVPAPLWKRRKNFF